MAARISAARRIKYRTLCSDSSRRPSSSPATNRCRRYPREYVVHVSQSQLGSNGLSSVRYAALRMFSVPSGVNAEPLRPPRVGATETEQTHAPLARRDQIRGKPDAHKITGQCRWQPRLEDVDRLVHLVLGLANRKPADRDARPGPHFQDAIEGLRPQRGQSPSLDDRPESLTVGRSDEIGRASCRERV